MSFFPVVAVYSKDPLRQWAEENGWSHWISRELDPIYHDHKRTQHQHCYTTEFLFKEPAALRYMGLRGKEYRSPVNILRDIFPAR